MSWHVALVALLVRRPAPPAGSLFQDKVRRTRVPRETRKTASEARPQRQQWLMSQTLDAAPSRTVRTGRHPARSESLRRPCSALAAPPRHCSGSASSWYDPQPLAQTYWSCGSVSGGDLAARQRRARFPLSIRRHDYEVSRAPLTQPSHKLVCRNWRGECSPSRGILAVKSLSVLTRWSCWHQLWTSLSCNSGWLEGDPL
jgi:hypothetical protein